MRIRQLLWIVWAGWVWPLAASQPWAHERSDLPTDPAIEWGRLPNGFRYVVAPNAEPKERFSLRLLVQVGSMHEAEDQRGYAHFVEHMAFSGTRNYPRQELLSKLQQIGLSHGPDVNAHTFADRTVYQMDGLLAEGPDRRLALEILRDFVDGVLFAEDEVEREREVVISEFRARDDHRLRSYRAWMKFLFPTHPLGDRIPIGTVESVRAASAATLRAFYDTWYRPDRIVLVAVGDFAVDEVRQEIEAIFGSLPRAEEALPEVPPVVAPVRPDVAVGVHREWYAGPAASYLLHALRPPLADASSEAWVEDLARAVAFMAWNRRLTSLQRKHSKRLGVIEAASFDGPMFREVLLRVDAGVRHWKLAVETAEQELRRARAVGFSNEEIEEVVAALLQQVEHWARLAPSRPSPERAQGLVDAVMDGKVVMAPEEVVRRYREVAPTLTAQRCHAAFRAAWGEGRPALFGSGFIRLKRAEEELVAVYRASERRPLPGLAARRAVAFNYETFGEPGRVVKRDQVADLDLHRVEFANGVRLNLKVTSYEEKTLRFAGRFGQGAASEPANKPGLRYLAGRGLLGFGLRQHDPDALQRLLAPHVLSLSMGVGEEAFYVSGTSDVQSASRWLQLLTAALTDPGWRASELVLARSAADFNLNGIRSDIDQFIAANRAARLASHDTRYRVPDYKALRRYKMRDLRAWLEPQMRTAPLELGIVGDFDVEEMIDWASRTLGTLPPRQPAPAVRPVNFAPTLRDLSPLTVSTAGRRAALQVTWPLPPERDHRSERQAEVLAAAFTNRLHAIIRGEMGASYAPESHIIRSELQAEANYLLVSLNCEPGLERKLAERVRELGAELAAQGMTDDEFTRAVQPKRQAAAAQLRNNAYWLHSSVSRAQSRPERLDWPRTRVSDLEQMAADELNALARRVLEPDQATFFLAAPAVRP